MSPPARVPASLWVVGTGIRAVSQMTPECRLQIEQADRVLYGVSDAVTTGWLHELNPRCESLGTLYQAGRPRTDIYRAMVGRILGALHEGGRVCVALYGHPGVCARAGHDSVQQARREGFEARMLPGISCEDCLFADLGLDPAADGCQSHEASVFLERRMQFDPRAALVLWQVGMLGCHDYQPRYTPQDMRLLAAHLQPAYGSEHEALLYELPSYASHQPIVHRTTIGGLVDAPTTWATTLLVPARAQPHRP